MNKQRIKRAQDSLTWCEVTNQFAVIDAYIRRVYNLKSVAPSDTVIQSAGAELRLWLNMEFPNIKTDELSYALELGATGEIGKDSYLNIANMMAWIKAYMGSTERNDALEELRKMNASVQIEDKSTVQEDRKFYNEKPQMLFDHVRQTGTIWSQGRGNGLSIACVGELIYDFLDGQGHFRQVSKETILKADELAKERIARSKAHTSDMGAIAFLGSMETEAQYRKVFLLEAYFKALIGAGRELKYTRI